jgi:uridine kinase
VRNDIVRLAESIRASAPGGIMATRIVAIDGGGGAGKSTLARRLAAALDEAPIIPTDHFVSPDDQFGWWPRLLEQVIVPLARGEIARYQRFDWNTRRLVEWIAIPHEPATVIIEGVAAMRREFDPYLAYRIWVDAPREVRLRRGLARDGEAMRCQWEQWMTAEAAYVANDRPIDRADVVVSGTGLPSGDR